MIREARAAMGVTRERKLRVIAAPTSMPGSVLDPILGALGVRASDVTFMRIHPNYAEADVLRRDEDGLPVASRGDLIYDTIRRSIEWSS